MSAATERRRLLRALERQGAHVERGTNHWKIKTTNGRLIAILPTHGIRDGDRNLDVKVRSRLRKEGFEV